jgi:hypothetical protein
MAPASASASRRPECGGCGPGLNGEMAGGVAAGTQRGPHRLGRIGDPVGDRGDRPGAGQHRGGGQVRMATRGWRRPRAARGPGNGGKVGQQVEGFGVLEFVRVGMGEMGQSGWDRG